MSSVSPKFEVLTWRTTRSVCLLGGIKACTDAVHTHVIETSVRPRLNPTEQACRSSVSLPVWCLGSIRLRSASCSSAISGFPFHPIHAIVRVAVSSDVLGHRAIVRVAVSSTSLATIVQLVLRCWVVGSILWKQLCCEAGATVGTNIMVRDMDLLP